MNSLVDKKIASPFSKGRQHQLKFQSILSEAAQLFNWQGSRATTLVDIAGSLKLTKTCVYYYVKTKEDLVYQCYVSSCDMWLQKARQANSMLLAWMPMASRKLLRWSAGTLINTSIL